MSWTKPAQTPSPIFGTPEAWAHSLAEFYGSPAKATWSLMGGDIPDHLPPFDWETDGVKWQAAWRSKVMETLEAM